MGLTSNWGPCNSAAADWPGTPKAHTIIAIQRANHGPGRCGAEG